MLLLSNRWIDARIAWNKARAAARLVDGEDGMFEAIGIDLDGPFAFEDSEFINDADGFRPIGECAKWFLGLEVNPFDCREFWCERPHDPGPFWDMSIHCFRP